MPRIFSIVSPRYSTISTHMPRSDIDAGLSAVDVTIRGYTGVFSVKRTYDDTDYILQCPMDGSVVDLTHEKTQGLAYGDYVWDVQLTLADGAHQTIGPGKFHMLPDVTTT